jgi:S1-C subfamily serine protease/thiol-disulfide isomerase/thioredoxin
LVVCGVAWLAIAGCKPAPAPGEKSKEGGPSATAEAKPDTNAPGESQDASSSAGEVASSGKTGQAAETQPAGTANSERASEAEKTNEPPLPEMTGKTPPAKSTPDAASNADVSNLIQRYDDAVVYLTVQNAMGEDVGLGSGFVIDPKGLVATNYHVVADGSRAFAQLRNGDKFEVEGYCAVDPRRDLVILQLRDPQRALEVFDLQIPGELQMGQLLVAMGHPEGFQFTATTGIVSAVRRTDELPAEYRQALSAPDDNLWIQTNAAISHGSSGGPLLNAKGELVGINTWIAAGQNIGFATHVTHLLELAKKVGASQSLPIRGSAGSRSYADREIVWLMQQYQTELQAFAAKSGQQSGGLLGSFFKPTNPTGEFMKKLMDLADKRRGERSAFEALSCICQIARYDAEGTGDMVRQALERLRSEHFADPNLGNAALSLVGVDTEDARQFLRDVMQKSEHEDARAYATLALGMNLVRVPAPTAKQRREMLSALERASNRYGDVLLGRATLREVSEDMLLSVKHFSYGSVPLPLEGKDHDGTPLSLAALKGQVVLVDFWADWCPYCREMYAVERKLLEKYSGRPFAILGVNADPPERYARLAQDKTVTWPSIADGPNGPNNEKWRVDSLPTVYVVDRHGIIRGLQLREEKVLEGLIEYLLDEPIYPITPDLVAFGAEWRYWNDAAAPPAEWLASGFDDAAWKAGPAPLGFGQFNEATVLPVEQGDSGAPHAIYFRHRFSVTDLAAVQDVVLALRCDDGGVVYLNGQEVARLNLANPAAHDTPASTVSSYDDGQEEILFALDPKLLQVGENILAVEVHQAKQGGFDARFDLALGTNVIASFAQIAGQKDAPGRTDALIALGRLGAAAATTIGTIEPLLNDDSPLVRMRAAEALALIAPERLAEHPFPEPRDEEESLMRERFAQQLNGHAWEACVPLGQPVAQYEQAARFLTVACLLAPMEASLINSRGLAELRTGKLDAALESFAQSQSMVGENAFDTLLLALTHQQKGETDKSQPLLAKARELGAKVTSQEQKDCFAELMSQVNE